MRIVTIVVLASAALFAKAIEHSDKREIQREILNHVGRHVATEVARHARED
jgi:hypothetical protein